MYAFESVTVKLFRPGRSVLTKEQENDIKPVKKVVCYFMFREYWVSAQALPTVPHLESVTMIYASHRYFVAVLEEEFGDWWKQLRGADAKIPLLLFKSWDTMESQFKVWIKKKKKKITPPLAPVMFRNM